MTAVGLNSGARLLGCRICGSQCSLDSQITVRVSISSVCIQCYIN